MRTNLPVTGQEIILRDDHLIVSKTDLKGRITYVNRDFIEISGFDETELIGEPHNLVRHPDMPPEAFEDLWNSLKDGRPWVGFVKNRCKNGDHYWVEAHAAPIWENGQVTGYMSVRRKPARDIVSACEKAYRDFREGKAKGKAIIDGRVLSSSLMARLTRRLAQLSLTAKLGIGCAIAAIVVMGASSEMLGTHMASNLQNRGVADLRQNLTLIRGMVEIRAIALNNEATRLNDLLATYFPGSMALETRDGEPLLKQGNVLLNGRFDEVDRFTGAAKAVATVFARKGDDFLRISTSLKKETGERAVGTLLGKAHPAYASIVAGQAFVGKAKLFGKDYYTAYRPIKDSAGAVIGILFVGLDISAELDALKRQVKSVKVGNSGYFFVLDAKPGTDQGMALIHPAKEGQVIIGAKDPSGYEFIKAMIEKKQGEIEYPWSNADDTPARRKIAVFETFDDWGWLIAGGTYLDEFDALANSMKHLLIGVSLIVGLLLVGIIVWLIRRLVYRPLHDQVLPAFRALSAGHYDNPLDTARHDEIGKVMQGLETMQNRLGFEKADSERKADEMARVMSALDYVSTPVRIADPKGTVIYANKSMLEALRRIEQVLQAQNPNFKVETFVGSSIGSLYADPAAALQRLSSLTSTVQTEMDIGGRTYRVLTSPVMSATSERLGSVGEWQDRTDEIAIEQEVSGIVENAQRGNLGERIEMAGKSGFFKILSERINGLLETTHQALIATSEVLSRVARGDLTQRIDKDYEGIFGQLKDDTNATVERLVEVVGRIKDATEAINIAAKEIASGNQDLSSRTEEQASSLQETASSMEEINATVRQNADSARQAEALASNSNELTARGSQMVKHVVDTMADIQGSSRRIADIIGVIDGIAFQTNILALNAAVEAARAGEQGRGFAVVATEVRNLAQRSATAAKEIKALIAESVDKVATGTRVVNDAGKTMDEIVASFEKVTLLVGDISNASREQASGIEQVTLAVGQMDEVTQQNAALVEEAAAAAESLEEQAMGLVQAVGLFKLTASQQPSVSPTSVRHQPQKRLPSTTPSPKAMLKAIAPPRKASDSEWEEF
jgi:methyl-accepting chemotaxis protein